MTFSLTWLPDVLEAAGLKVAEVDGWQARGHGDMGEVMGVLCHHTGGPKTGNMPSLGTVLDGRPDLPGPLSQLGLGRDGTYYVIAAGRCNHAGKGEWKGITAGNSQLIGIEAENTGLPGDYPWPPVQLDAYRRGVAAILKEIGRNAQFCAAHREYATPKGRKSDPTFDMDEFRSSVDLLLRNPSAPSLIPSAEEVAPGTSGRATLRRGDVGRSVAEVQRHLGLEPTNTFDAKTEAAVRAFQRSRGLVADGIVGPKSWAALDLLAVVRTAQTGLPRVVAAPLRTVKWTWAKLTPGP